MTDPTPSGNCGSDELAESRRRHLDVLHGQRDLPDEIAVDPVPKHELKEQLLEAIGAFNDSTNPAERTTLIYEIRTLRVRLKGLSP